MKKTYSTLTFIFISLFALQSVIVGNTQERSTILLVSSDSSEFWLLNSHDFSREMYWTRNPPVILVDILIDNEMAQVYTLERTNESASLASPPNTIKRLDLLTRQEYTLYTREGLFRIISHPNPDYLLVRYFAETSTDASRPQAMTCLLNIVTGQCNDVDGDLQIETLLWISGNEFVSIYGWVDLVNLISGNRHRLIDDKVIVAGTFMPDGETLLLLGWPLPQEQSTSDLYVYLYDLETETYRDIGISLPRPSDTTFVNVDATGHSIVYSYDRNGPGFVIANLETGQIVQEFPEMDEIIWFPDRLSFLSINRQYQPNFSGTVSLVDTQTGIEDFWFQFDGYVHFGILNISLND